MMTDYIYEPARSVPVRYETDICIVGGSCTGVFAAVRAARLGARVLIVEKQNKPGGVAVSGLVNVWHSLHDTAHNNRIIAGLTEEMLERLAKRDDIVTSGNDETAYRFNPCSLAIELENMIRENRITLLLHSFYCAASVKDGALDAIFVENKAGRFAIRAGFFIDASGDGDIARDVGLVSYKHEYIQPPSSCFLMQGDTDKLNLGKLISEHGGEFGLDDDWGWYSFIPGLDNISFRADFHVFDVDCANAEELTSSELEGRRKADAFSRLLQKYCGKDYKLAALCSYIGIRESRHYETVFKANETELLTGTAYPDAIMRGTYRADRHHNEDNGITFRYLDGREETIYGKSGRKTVSDWRREAGITGAPALYYELPFRALVQESVRNFIPVGRMLNADPGAFGALRVMVNLNQLGEAAGTAAYMSLHESKPVNALDGAAVRSALVKGGSAL